MEARNIELKVLPKIALSISFLDIDPRFDGLIGIFIKSVDLFILVANIVKLIKVKTLLINMYLTSNFWYFLDIIVWTYLSMHETETASTLIKHEYLGSFTKN